MQVLSAKATMVVMSEGALCRMSCVVSAYVGVVEGVASGFGVNSQGVCSVLALPLLDHRMDGIDKTVLGH